MRNKLLIGVLCAVMLLGTLAGAVTVGYAWLSPGKTVSVAADGTAVASYFAGGTGTEDDPYILKTPQHVYNLAWLQYMGVFNVTDANGNLEDQYFFRLDSDIDMQNEQKGVYQIIPPIGTLTNPFVGNFDGNGKTISNAIVANFISSDKGDTTNNIKEYPPSVDEVRDAEIIGFFGIIGNYEEVDSAGTTTVIGKTIGLSDDQLKDLKVANLTLDNVTIVTEPHSVGSEKLSLLGLFAGFVNGTITNVKVKSGTVAVNRDVGPYDAFLKDPTEDATGPFHMNVTRSMSKYTLIGDYFTTQINWEGGPLDGPTSDVGTNEGFGGSIDMLSLAKRVTYMMGAGSTDGGNAYRPADAIRTKYHLFGYTGGEYDFDYTNASNRNAQQFYFYEGTYLPLNIDLDTLLQSNYTPQAGSGESIHENNTGYLVGKFSETLYNGTMSGNNTSAPRFEGRKLGQLCFSLQGTHTDWITLGTYTADMDKNVQILTKDTEGTYYVIGDDLNGLTAGSTPYDCYTGISVKTYEDLNLTQYRGDNNVRGKLADMLMGQTLAHGLRLVQAKPTSSDAVSVDAVVLGKHEVDSLVEGTIHFYSEGSGVITMVAASFYTQVSSVTSSTGKADYASNSTASSTSSIAYLPMLYKVTRDSNGNISALEAITTIYKSSSGDIEYNTNPGNYTKVFDYNTMGALVPATGAANRTYMNSLYYFEYPIKEGEYVLGGYGSAPAYLLYLDIGGNAGSQGSEGEGDTDNPNTPNYSGEISGVFFVDPNGNPIVQFTNDDGTPGAAVAFDIKNDASNGGGSITFSGTSSGVTQSNVKGSMSVEAVIKENDPADSGGSG